MAPSHSRQLLVWTLPTIAVLLSYLWYKKKRIGVRSDTGDTRTRQEIERLQLDKNLQQELEEADKPAPVNSTPARNFSRSLSGVESAPIDIIIPPELRSSKSQPVDISEEELDLQIEKIKSMKNGTLSRSRSDYSPPQAQISRAASSSKASSQENKEIVIKETAEMAQTDIAVVEEKLTSLKINNNNNKETPRKREHKNSISKAKEQEQNELQRQSSERDSANHSPVDVMLASASLGSISDNHSEGSSDSGKGGSDVPTPPQSRTPGSDVSASIDIGAPDPLIQYEFFIPQHLVGKLIGRNGSSVKQLKEKTNTNILVMKCVADKDLKVCSIVGTESDIDKAKQLIRIKFPEKKFPELTLERIHFTHLSTTIPLIPDHLYLKLVEGINNDTILSCIVTPNHLFLQQPTHPTFPTLNLQSSVMNGCYAQPGCPLLPDPIPENTLCVAHSVGAWHRAIVLSSEGDESYVKFLDYGGYVRVKNSELRRIRGDFMLLPFQAAECYLANVKPINEDGTWHQEAYDLVAEITKGAIIYTQVADYAEDGVPLVLCYVVVGPRSVVFLNQHLVDNGFAEWVPDVETMQQDNTEGAVGGINA